MNPGCPDTAEPRVTKQEEIPHHLLRAKGAGQRREQGQAQPLSWGREGGSSALRLKQLLGNSRKETQKVSKKDPKRVSKNLLCRTC